MLLEILLLLTTAAAAAATPSDTVEVEVEVDGVDAALHDVTVTPRPNGVTIQAHTAVLTHRRHATDFWRFDVPPTPHGVDEVLRLEAGESADLDLAPGFWSIRAWPAEPDPAAPPPVPTETVLSVGPQTPSKPPPPHEPDASDPVAYTPADAALFDEPWPLAPALRAALADGSVGALRAALREEAPGVYSIPLFEPAFGARLAAELRRASQEPGLGLDRPNSMNRYGVVVDQIGLSPRVDELMAGALQPFARLLFPAWGGDALDDGHHAFSISYRLGGDVDLARHMDASTVTLNVCLGSEFAGGAVVFEGERDGPGMRAAVDHEVGRALIHVGQHWHSAEPITAGARDNLVVWARSKYARESPRERFGR